MKSLYSIHTNIDPESRQVTENMYRGIELCSPNINFKEDHMKTIIKTNEVNDIFHGLEMVVLKIK